MIECLIALLSHPFIQLLLFIFVAAITVTAFVERFDGDIEE